MLSLDSRAQHSHRQGATGSKHAEQDLVDSEAAAAAAEEVAEPAEEATPLGEVVTPLDLHCPDGASVSLAKLLSTALPILHFVSDTYSGGQSTALLL